jgi:hypothetical protein
MNWNVTGQPARRPGDGDCRAPMNLSNRPLDDWRRRPGMVAWFPGPQQAGQIAHLMMFRRSGPGGKVGHCKNLHHRIFDRARADVGPAAGGAGAPSGPACPQRPTRQGRAAGAAAGGCRRHRRRIHDCRRQERGRAGKRARPVRCGVHNVAVGYQEPRRIETEDRLPEVFAANTLAPYILTALMERPARLVYLSSGLHRGASSNLDDIAWVKRRWNGSAAYSESKLHDVLLAFGIARRWPDVFSIYGVR